MKRVLPVFLALLLLFIPLTAQGATNNTSTGKLAQLLTYQTISGYTSTYNPVSQIGVTLNLQYLSNGNWYTVKSYKYTKADASYVSGGQNLGVSTGYYYRDFAEHTAYNGSTYETGYSYTEPVYVP